MANQQLVDYINQSRRTGSTDEQIRQALSTSGWSEQDIQAAINSGLNSASPTQAFLSRNYFSVGLGTLILSVLLSYLYWTYGTNAKIALWLSAYVLLVLLAQAIVLLILLKVFKIENSAFGKSLFFVGIIGLATVLYQFFNLLHLSSVISLIIFLTLVLGSFALLKKLYLLSISKAIWIGIAQGIVGGAISIAIFFIFAFAGLLSLANLFQSSVNDNQNSIQNGIENNNQTPPNGIITQTPVDFQSPVQQKTPQPTKTQPPQIDGESLPSGISEADFSKAISNLPSGFPTISKNSVISVDNFEVGSSILFHPSQPLTYLESSYQNFFKKIGWPVKLTTRPRYPGSTENETILTANHPIQTNKQVDIYFVENGSDGKPYVHINTN